MLLQLVVSYAEISKITKYSDTLTETIRKQNIRQGLTNITDEAYLFFDKLNHTIRELETLENLYSHGDTVIEYIKSRLLENYTLLQNWMLLFHVDESDEDDLFLLQAFSLK